MHQTAVFRRALGAFGLATLLGLTGCASGLQSRFADSLAQSIQNADDIETLRAGIPAYLVLLDAMLALEPENSALLTAAARLNTSYAGAFVGDTERARRLTDKALNYARRDLCPADPRACGQTEESFTDFAAGLESFSSSDVPRIMTLASAWAQWIRLRSSDWQAIAQLPKIEALLLRAATLDETYQFGQAHLYLGILRSLRPPALGGNPEQGRQHFERALELSNRQNLQIQVAYAQFYARTTFDRALHDRLLQEALDRPAQVPGLTLSNHLAQQQARQLLAESAAYFQE